jgi:hypothetical protein
MTMYSSFWGREVSSIPTLAQKLSNHCRVTKRFNTAVTKARLSAREGATRGCGPKRKNYCNCEIVIYQVLLDPDTTITIRKPAVFLSEEVPPTLLYTVIYNNLEFYTVIIINSTYCICWCIITAVSSARF